MSNLQNKSNNVSTKGFQFYNANAGDDSSTLVMGYWNDMVSIKIHPVLPQNARQNNQMYNYNGGLSSVIGIKATEQLIQVINKIEKKEIMCGAVKGSTNTVIKIGDGSEYGDDFGWYLAIFETNEQGAGTNGWFYVFNESSRDDIIMGDYNEEDGTFNQIVVNAEVQLFKEFLESSKQVFFKTIAHSATQRMGYMIDKVSTEIAVVKGMNEQILYGRNASNSDQQQSAMGTPRTAGQRNFATRRRRGADSYASGNTQAEETGSPAPAPASVTGTRRRGASTPTVNSVNEDDLEQQLLDMSDDEDLDLD